MHWKTWLEIERLTDLRPAGSLVFSGYDQIIPAAIAGHGVALGRSPLVRKLLASGELVAPFKRSRRSGARLLRHRVEALRGPAGSGRLRRLAEGRGETGESLMYAGKYAVARAGEPAFIMAGSGESVSYAEFDARTNRLAHLLRAQGLRRLDHYAIFMENNNRYLESCGAGERSGLYYTCVNSYLTAEELAYILQNSESQVLITSQEKREVAAQASENLSPASSCAWWSAEAIDRGLFADFETAVGGYPGTPIADEAPGHADALLLRHHRAPERHPAAAAARTRLPSRCRCSTSCTSCGATARR